MRNDRTTSHRGRAKLALILLGVISCIGGAAYALAQAGRAPAPPVGAAAAAAGSSAKSFTIRIAPLTHTVSPGETVNFTVQIRGGQRRRVNLRIAGGVPPEATASFRRAATRKSRTTLTIATGAAPSGGHRIRLLARSGARRATAALNIVISSEQPTNFAISGDLTRPLIPGLAVPLDLSLTNPGPVEIAISGLDVSVSSVVAPQASAAYPCTVEDFEATQFSGSYGFTVPAASTHSLTELGIPEAQLPHVGMLDLPVNQNGCKGSSLGLDFSGTATGGA